MQQACDVRQEAPNEQQTAPQVHHSTYRYDVRSLLTGLETHGAASILGTHERCECSIEAHARYTVRTCNGSPFGLNTLFQALSRIINLRILTCWSPPRATHALPPTSAVYIASPC